MNPLPSSTSRNAASSRGISGSYSARTSTRGIVCTRRHFSHSDPAVHQIRERRDDAYRDCVLDVAEAVVEAAIAGAEPVAGSREGERPHGGAGQREERVRQEPHLEDSGCDGNERTDDRRQPAEEDAEVPPPLEPSFGAVQAARREVEPAAVALEEWPAPVPADRPADEGADEVAERPGKSERDVGTGTKADPRTEQRHPVRGREDSRCDCARIQHHELARGREEGVDRHQAEDGVDAVIRYCGGEARGDAREEHRADTSDAWGSRTVPRANSSRWSSSPARRPGSARRTPGDGGSGRSRSPAPSPPAEGPSGASPPRCRSGAGSARGRSPRATA